MVANYNARTLISWIKQNIYAEIQLKPQFALKFLQNGSNTVFFLFRGLLGWLICGAGPSTSSE